MCGICGIVYKDVRRNPNPETLTKMQDILLHRGPDDEGVYIAPGIGLGSRRLAILDLSQKAHMPMKTPDGRFWIAYNGEVFNSPLLREELSQQGISFQSRSDTEVVLHLYAREGPAMLERLNGMFAIAIWDTYKKELFLARDHLGIKPLYYTLNGEALSFASEAKAFTSLDVPLQFDPEVLQELLCFRHVAGERTCFRNVKKILPGHYLIWNRGEIKIKRWWHLGERSQSRFTSPQEDFRHDFSRLLDDSVRLRTLSDVPLGVFLSGGLDSNAVATSLAIQIKEPVKTFMIRFKDPSYDEGALAQATATRWGFEHHELYAEIPDFLSLLKKSSWFNDEPLAHGNDLYFYLLSGYAKPKVTVLLTGEGADEILGGYVRYMPLRYPNLLKAMQPWSRCLKWLSHSRLRKTARFLKMNDLMRSFILYNSCNVLPYELEKFGMKSKEIPEYRETVLAEAQSFFKEPVRQAMYLDQHTFLCSLLDRNDRMTMGASIECRPPFLDHRLVELAARLPTALLFKHNRGKAILHEAMKSRLPTSVLRHRKWGFTVPWHQYLRTDQKLRDYLKTIPEKEPFSCGVLEIKALKQIIGSFLKGSNENYDLILEVFMITIWYESFFSEKNIPMHPRSF